MMKLLKWITEETNDGLIRQGHRHKKVRKILDTTLKWIIAGALIVIPTVVEVDVLVGQDQDACVGVSVEFWSQEHRKPVNDDDNGLLTAP